MNLTVEEKIELSYLRELRSSRTRVMMPIHKHRLSYLLAKERHNHCPNPTCTRYEGEEHEVLCPKCGSKILKTI